MAESQAHLGDSHNFGRRVSARGRRIEKPRTLAWEWLLLSRKSPLRRLLEAAARRDGLGTAFAFLPDLQFSRPRSRSGGSVERVVLEPLGTLPRSGKRELASIVGRSLALFGWLGVADLHWENLVLGRDALGRIVFGPLDVEMILGDLSTPTETKLLPDTDPEVAAICRHACGVRRVLPYLGKPLDPRDLVTMAGSYRRTLEWLDGQGDAIARVLSRLPRLQETPIRVCLRGTDEYVRARSAPLSPPLLDAEAVQLARGDIPYFFRLYGRAGIHYYTNRALTKAARLPLKGDVPRLDPLLDLRRGLRSPTRRSLREQGLFTLLGAFDHASFTGEHEHEGFAVKFGARRLSVTLPNGDELSAPRDLGAFVGSVYLPCRCGEVRAVFVPPVTSCRAALRSQGRVHRRL
jgi:hypothetical protein